MRALLKSDVPVGKKLDFIAQEMQRETNTMGSKLMDEVVSRAVIALKSKIEKVRDYCRRIRDTGAMVGVSTHIPDVVENIVSEDWDVDFFMCCVYERHRTREQLLELLGHVPIPLKEVYLESDPPRMYRAMRSTDKPCLAFKILAAGRLSDQQELVEAAFQQAFSLMKPNDAVIVGMYPEYEDQVAINAGYVRRFTEYSSGSPEI